MKFQNRDIKLAIFDLDGTLVSSTSVWADVDTKFFRKRGMDVPEDYGRAIAHLGLDKAAKYTKETRSSGNYFALPHVEPQPAKAPRYHLENIQNLAF